MTTAPSSERRDQRSQARVVCIGECMVELARGPDGRFGLAYGGDTFNMAVYLSRCGVSVAYATVLGDDPYSGAIQALAASEGIGCDLIRFVANRSAGLYLIETAADGERSFHYWRDRAPARELFDDDASAGPVAAAMCHAPLVVFSGITLSLYQPAALDRFANALAAARAAGARIVMDGNFRPRGWAGDLARARATFERFWRLADVAMPTLDDEAMLTGDTTPAAVIERLGKLGPREIVVKQGAEGATVCQSGLTCHVPIPAKVAAVDTSAAGDSFNAAYLAGRLAGACVRDAVLAGHRLAGVVVQHRGTIAPATATVAATGSAARR